MRVTAKTERLLSRSVNTVPVDGIGGPKKEFPALQFFRAVPFQDYPFHRIFFNQLGAHYSLAPISRQAAQLRLMFMTRSFFRPDTAGAMARYLDFWGGVVRGRACFALELSPDLTMLDELVRFLQDDTL